MDLKARLLQLHLQLVKKKNLVLLWGVGYHGPRIAIRVRAMLQRPWLVVSSSA